jgi:hypothetical protein
LYNGNEGGGNMTSWPSGWDQRFAAVGLVNTEPAQALDGDDRTQALVQLVDEVFSTVNSFETNEDQYNAICEEFYPGGKIDLLSKEVNKIAEIPFKMYTKYEGISKDVLTQIQRQIIGQDDFVHLHSYPPEFREKLQGFRALQIACRMDPEIAEYCKPKLLGGSFGAQLHYIVDNVPIERTFEETASAIIRFKNTHGIDALHLKKSFVIKCPSDETQRCGISPHQEVCREEWSYAAQQIVGANFGIPPTVCSWVPFNGILQWCSIQEFIEGAEEFDGKADDFYSSIPLEEFHKLVFDILSFSTDRAFRNLMTDGAKNLHLIDNGLHFPDPSDEYSLREGQFQWISLPQAHLPLTETPVVSKIQSVDIEEFIDTLSERTAAIALRSKGWNAPMSQNTQDLIHFTLLLIKVGIETQTPMQNIAATLVPLRDAKLNKLLGGEVLTLMNEIRNERVKKKKIHWKVIEKALKKTLVTPLEKREKHGRQLFLADFLNTTSNFQEDTG